MGDPADADRLLLVEIAGHDVIRVVLRVREGVDLVGEADVSRSGSPAEAAAQATLDALAYAAPPDVRMSLDWFGVIETGPGNPDIVAVLVGLVAADETQQLAGAVAVRNDVTVAAARAALDATNRRLQIMGPG